jgi:hypothetical protein
MQWSTGHSTSCEPISWLNSKRSGREPGKLDRPADPGEILLGGVEEGFAAEALVDQHAVAFCGHG